MLGWHRLRMPGQLHSCESDLPPLQGTIQEDIEAETVLPVILLSTEEIFVDLESLLHLIDAHDDVFVPEFGSIPIEKPSFAGPNVTSHVDQANGTRRLYHLSSYLTAQEEGPGDSESLPSAPCFLHGPRLHEAWRLYEDHLNAFGSSVIAAGAAGPEE